MADIFLSNGDIPTTIYGDVAVVESYDEITQSAINNILTVYGENEYHTELGNMVYKRRLKFSSSSIETIKKDCINAIMIDERIDSVLSIKVSYDDDNKNNVNIEFTIKTVDGTVTSSAIIIVI